jgi:hypothetical protein
MNDLFTVSFSSTLPEVDLGIVMLMIDPHFLYSHDNSTDTFRMSLYSAMKKIKYKILYLTEPIDYMIDKKIVQDVIRHIQPYCLWMYSHHLRGIFPSIRSFVIVPSIFSIPPSLNQTRRRDKIVFIGKVNPYRQEILNTFGESVLIVDNQYELVSYYTSFLFFLNLHRRKKTQCLETFRVCPILYYGGVVLSQDVCLEDKNAWKDASIYYEEESISLCSLYHSMASSLEEPVSSTVASDNQMCTFMDWTLSILK